MSLQPIAIQYDTKEEILNSISHGIGLVLSVLGLIFLITYSISHGTIWHTVSSIIYGASLILLYMSSTLYHTITIPKAKRWFKTLDHVAIYLLIAGTYTPFTLTCLRGPWGWSLFGTIWGLALVGVILKTMFTGKFNFLFTMIYLLMGWLVIIAAKPLFSAITFDGGVWLVAGGIIYSAGIGFYLWNKLPYNHAIWHFFVLGGSVCHFISVMINIPVHTPAT
ncbi:MAG: hemolysin III family protein [Candidatus Brocadiales bacterium]|nr:hemolysin III family protein [Candidatus Brocadiales bacterium]